MKSIMTQLHKKAAGMFVIGFAIILVVIALEAGYSHPTTASASGGDLSTVRSVYPAIANTRLDSCSLCHTSSIPGLNRYGAAYKANRRNSSALVAIAGGDADRDGFTNAQEIAALTFPGDPNDHPTAPATTQPPATEPPATQPATTQPPAATQPPATAAPTVVSPNPYPGPTTVNPYPAPANPTTVPSQQPGPKKVNPYPGPGNPTAAPSQQPAPTQNPKKTCPKRFLNGYHGWIPPRCWRFIWPWWRK